MSMRYILGIVLIFFLLGSCSKEPTAIDVYSIPEEFIIDLHQTPMPGGTIPSFKISTLKLQPCAEDKMNVDISKTNNDITIEVKEIITVSGCTSSSGRISVETYTEMPVSEYNLNISLKNQINNYGKVSIGANNYSMSLETLHGIRAGKMDILKVPDNLFWGVVSTKNSSTVVGLPLLDRIGYSPIEKASLTPGDYGLFLITENGDIELEGVTPFESGTKFIGKLKDSVSNMKEIVQEYIDENPEHEVSITTSYEIII
jgi:hypothetical protein